MARQVAPGRRRRASFRLSDLSSANPQKVCFPPSRNIASWVSIRRSAIRQSQGDPPMSPLRPLIASGAFLSLSALLLGLSGCSSGSSTGPIAPPSYTLTATALNPGSVTAGNACTSTLTVSTSSSTPGGNYTITVAGSDAKSMAPSNGSQALTLTTAAVIQHIVVIFQENRTPDNLFQDPVLIKNGADIAQSGVNSAHQTITLSPIDLGT